MPPSFTVQVLEDKSCFLHIQLTSASYREAMPRSWKRQTGTPGPDKKKLFGKCTKTENSARTSVNLENSSLEKTTTFTNPWQEFKQLLADEGRAKKSARERNRHEVQRRGSQSTVQADRLLGWGLQLSGKETRGRNPGATNTRTHSCLLHHSLQEQGLLSNTSFP